MDKFINPKLLAYVFAALVLALFIKLGIRFIRDISKEGLRVRNKLLDYFILGGLVGSLIEFLLYCCAMVLIYPGSLILVIVYFIVPILQAFIPFGFLGILALLVIRKYYSMVSMRRVCVYLIFLGGLYYIILPIGFGILRSIIYGPVAIYGYASFAVKSMFSMKAVPCGFIPNLPGLVYTLINSITGVCVCFLSLLVFRRTSTSTGEKK